MFQVVTAPVPTARSGWSLHSIAANNTDIFLLLAVTIIHTFTLPHSREVNMKVCLAVKYLTRVGIVSQVIPCTTVVHYRGPCHSLACRHIGGLIDFQVPRDPLHLVSVLGQPVLHLRTGSAPPRPRISN